MGVLYNRDPRLARILIQLLQHEEGLIVGDNELCRGHQFLGGQLVTVATAAWGQNWPPTRSDGGGILMMAREVKVRKMVAAAFR